MRKKLNGKTKSEPLIKARTRLGSTDHLILISKHVRHFVVRIDSPLETSN